MAESSVDILMMVVGQDGVMDGESLTEFTATLATDMLRKGFLPGQFSDLTEFSFAAGVASAMDKNKDDKKKDAAAGGAQAAAALPARGPSALERQLAAVRERHDKANAVDQARRDKVVARTQREFVDIEPVEYTRIMDNSSTLLFKALSQCETLPRISVVKRKASGRNASGDCYLRLDFENVLMTKLDWKDTGHVMMESGEFIYRKLTIQYRPQRPDGTLGKVIQAAWDMQATRTPT